jgi:HrpA-like RNA helicase
MITFLIKGNIIPQPWDNKKEINDMVPIDHVMNWFSDRLSGMFVAKSIGDLVLLVRAETGSGKSTLQITELFHKFHENQQRNIVITEPRRINAINIAQDIIHFNTREMLDKLGYYNREPLELEKNVGFQTGILTKKPISGIIYMTLSTLLQQLKVMSDDQIMDKYFVIVIDEIHQRSIDSDLTIYMIKKFIERNYENPKCPLILLTSATFDIKKFADYFKVKKNIIEIRGLSYPIEEIFLKEDSDNFVITAVNLVSEIHKKYKDDFISPSEPDLRDILIFVNSIKFVNSIVGKLKKINDNDSFFNKYPVMVLSLTGEIVSKQGEIYQSLFLGYDDIKTDIKGKRVKAYRRIIVSTSVSETGVTFENLKYVIDSGYQNVIEFNPNNGFKLLVGKPVTKNNAIQRKGRIGRRGKGIWFPLYTKENYNLLLDKQYSEIVVADITDFILNIIVEENGITNIENFRDFFSDYAEKWSVSKLHFDIKKVDLLDSPPIDNIKFSIEKLFVLGYIDRNLLPTKIGILSEKIRMIPVESKKMILAGYAWGVSINDLVIIAAALTMKKTSLISFKMMKLFDDARKKKSKFTFGMTLTKFNLEIGDDEFLILLAIVKEFETFLEKRTKQSFESLVKKKLIEDWTEQHGIVLNVLLEIIELRDEIIENMLVLGFNPYENYDNSIKKNPLRTQIFNIKQCIYEGYKFNLMKLVSPNVYKVVRNNQTIIFYEYSDKYIICSDIFYISRNGIYYPNINYISVITGYVIIDENFFS